MKLNSKQTKIVALSILLFISMGLYLPWVYIYDGQVSHTEKPAGYSLITQPPQPEKESSWYGVGIDIDRLSIQWLTLLMTTLGLLLLSNTSKNQEGANSHTKDNSETISEHSAKHSKQDENITQYPFSPNMPDVTKCASELTFKENDYMLLFVKNPPTIAESVGGQSFPITYKYTVVVVNSNDGMPKYFVTLESGLAGEGFLCAFDRNGEHQNLGNHLELLDENMFVVKALEIIKEEFGFNDIEEVPLTSV